VRAYFSRKPQFCSNSFPYLSFDLNRVAWHFKRIENFGIAENPQIEAV
jgi:hypothetical protein